MQPSRLSAAVSTAFATAGRRLAASTLFGLLALSTSGCDALSNMISPGDPANSSPARLSLEATIPRFQGSSFSRVEVRVTADYLLATEGSVLLGSQLVTLSEAATQQLPLSIELGACLVDRARVDATAVPPVCVVDLTVALLGDGRELDRAVVRNIRLAAGATTTVAQPVQLFEVGSVAVTAVGSQTPLPIAGTSVVAGSTFAAGARVTDGSGQAVIGRTIAWSSNNPAIATVSSAGVVTGVTAGSATITASTGGRSGSALFLITPPVRRLSVSSVSSTGTGRIASVPAGIDCAITAGVPSGSCAADFLNGTSVQLTATPSSPNGSRFDGWTGACIASGVTPTCTLVMDQARATGGSFSALTLLTLRAARVFDGVRATSTAPSATGALLSCNYGLALTGNCALPFVTGSSLTVLATELPFEISRVIGWSGCDSSTRLTCTLTLTSSARQITLDASPGNRLRIVFADNGRITTATGFSGGAVVPLNCGTTVPLAQRVCETGFPIASRVVLTAIPESGYSFRSWGDSPCDSILGAQCIIARTSGDGSLIEAYAEFVSTVVPVTLLLSGSGGGTVFADSVAVCVITANQTSTQCTLNLSIGSRRFLQGVPAGGGQFLGFGGACPPGPTCTLIVAQATTVTASFTSAAPSALVRVQPAPGNAVGGWVIGANFECDIVGLNSTGTCSQSFPVGTSLTLTANDDDRILGSQIGVFTQWGPTSPCPNSPLPSCTFTVGSNGATVVPQFVLGAKLTVGLDGGRPGTLAITISGYRAIPSCNFVSAPIDCVFLLPRARTLSVNASTASGGNVDTNDFPSCSWMGASANLRSCSFSMSGDLSHQLGFYGPPLLRLPP